MGAIALTIGDRQLLVNNSITSAENRIISWLCDLLKFREKNNNKKWRSHLDELDQLGIKENPTVRKLVKFHSTKRVEDARALFRRRKREADCIPSPCGYFVQALKEN